MKFPLRDLINRAKPEPIDSERILFAYSLLKNNQGNSLNAALFLGMFRTLLDSDDKESPEIMKLCFILSSLYGVNFYTVLQKEGEGIGE